MDYRRFCQSCAMPMDEDSLLGTEKDGSPSQDYCKYCYEHGDFTRKVSMEEFIDWCSQFGEEAGMTKEQMREQGLKIFPTLKRWKGQQ